VGKQLAQLQVFKLGLISVAAAITLAACTQTATRAPVIERLPGRVAQPAPSIKSPKAQDWRPQAYTVQKGDTLYSIALEHGYDYKEIAEWNGIQAPYTIRIGQVLRLGAAQAPTQSDVTTPLKPAPTLEVKPLASSEPMRKTEPKAIKLVYSDLALAQIAKDKGKPSNGVGNGAAPKPEIAKVAPPKPAPTPEPIKSAPLADDDDKVDWGWPAEGKILANFNDNGNAKGLDIGGTLGQPVIAAAAGKVVHTGSTLRGYGKLIIIKHNKSYFSVYAHNNQVLVREGQTVVKGQRVGEMGNSDADRVKLHFEIRYLGKPVDPLKFLPNDRPS
jgi:lipoprotein NlpD